MKMLIDRPFMGTALTTGRGIATVAVAPVFWSLFALAFAAMPS